MVLGNKRIKSMHSKPKRVDLLLHVAAIRLVKSVYLWKPRREMVLLVGGVHVAAAPFLGPRQCWRPVAQVRLSKQCKPPLETAILSEFSAVSRMTCWLRAAAEPPVGWARSCEIVLERANLSAFIGERAVKQRSGFPVFVCKVLLEVFCGVLRFSCVSGQ